MVKIKVKKLHPEAVIPKFMNKGDAGADLTATSVEIKNGHIIYGLGIATEIPNGYCMKIYPRSSIYKAVLRLANNTGIIDSKFREEIKLIFDINTNVFFERYLERKSMLQFTWEDMYKPPHQRLIRDKITEEDIIKAKNDYISYTYDDYLKEIIYHPTTGAFYRVGDRIGQAVIEKLVPIDYIEVQELDMNNDRGGGFGSTDRKREE
jgi:dUTP pyrophosphatase